MLISFQVGLALLALCSWAPGEQKVNRGPEWPDCGLVGEERGECLGQRNLWKRERRNRGHHCSPNLAEDLKNLEEGKTVAVCVCVFSWKVYK